MNSHEIIDGFEGWIRSRQDQAPVDSTMEDLERFTNIEPREPHPNVEPTSLSFGLPERSRSVFGFLPPSRVPRIERSFEFPSPVQSSRIANDIVTGVRWHGEERESASAAAIMLHGAFAPDFTAERFLSVPLLRRDIHLFAPATPYHMERAPPESKYSGQYLLSGDVPRFIEGMIQAVADIRTLVATLREEGYDPIYLFGISLGGNIAAQTVTMTNVDGAVLAIPAVDLFETIERAPIAKGIRREAIRAGFEESDIRAAIRPITPRLLGPPVPDSSDIHVIYGQWDRQAPADAIEELLAEWSGVSSTRYPAGHRTMGLRIFGLRHQLAGWLDAKMAMDSGKEQATE
ncbi:alpha/beta fold hydrolase [Haladaptatus sp. NG-SE-30]